MQHRRRKYRALEEIKNVVGRMECDLAGESIGQDSDPNRDGSGNDCPVRGDLDVDILKVIAILVVFVVLAVPTVLVALVALDVIVLLNPTETNKVDGRMPDVSLVEEFNNLGTNVSPQIAEPQEGHKP